LHLLYVSTRQAERAPAAAESMLLLKITYMLLNLTAQDEKAHAKYTQGYLCVLLHETNNMNINTTYMLPHSTTQAERAPAEAEACARFEGHTAA